VFGGEFPAPDILSRLFVLHVLIIPVAIATLLAVHLAVIWRQKHTQFAAPGRREDNVVGSRFWPQYAAKSMGLFAIVSAVLAALGGLAQINPIWLYGPFEPAAVTTAAQPDWYLGWIEGALRIAPPWFLDLGSYSVSEIFWPAVALPFVTFALLYAWPFLEARVTGDRAEHHLLDRPSDRPVRSAIGVGVLSFYAVLLLAGAQDLWAELLDVSIPSLVWTFRVLLFIVPLGAALFTWKLCFDLRAAGAAAAVEAAAELPIGPNEPEVPAARVATAAPMALPARMLRSLRAGFAALAKDFFSLLLLAVLRAAGARRGGDRARRDG
jgi:ubiquinol-cytochrome c reductase cytochrome b subunit